MKLKRITALFLSAAMLLSAAACDNSSDAQGEIIGGADEAQSMVVAEQASAKVTISDGKFMVNGNELWINGVNTPWYSWNDFTGNMNEEVWEETFAQLAEDNINCTRIWINCNGQQICRPDKNGKVTIFSEGHWDDLDKLFALAEKYKVYVMPTFLSFDHFKGNGSDNWRKVLTDHEMADRYAEVYVKEFCDRYKDCEYIFGIDLMNEPDWVYENEECGQIGWDDLSYFFGTCAATIHENSDFIVTVGLAIIKYNSDKYEGNKIADEYLKELTGNENAYIDFYSTHYYAWQKSWFGFPFNVTPEEFGLDTDKPCLIGETSNDNEAEYKMNLTEVYKTAYDKGWNGVMVWMEPNEETGWYRYDLTKQATNDFYEYQPEKVKPIG